MIYCQFELTIPSPKGNQTVFYQVSKSMMNTGFKFSFLAPTALEEKILSILKTHPLVQKQKIKNDSLEEALLSLGNEEVEIKNAGFTFRYSTIQEAVA